jgi:hypothetical protein
MQSKEKILNNTVEPFGTIHFTSALEIICIDNTGYEEFLTIGKKYKAIGRLRKVEGIYYFGLHNDRFGTKDSYPIDLFLTKEEFREKQLNKILQ